MAFLKFELLPQLNKAIQEKGYTEPTTIQSQAIPLILEGHDLLAGSQTGTGKTAGFTLPLLQKLMKKQKNGPGSLARALILTPTRELALQVENSVRELGKYLPLRSIAIFGGVDFRLQIKKIRSGVDIIVATPGRLLDLIEQRIINLSQIEILVLDEADRMLDMGFIDDIHRVLKLIPQSRQSLLFSATFSPAIKKLAQELLKTPKLIEPEGLNSTVESVSQIIHPVDTKRKSELLTSLIQTNNWRQVLIFIRTKYAANRLAMQLSKEGISATAFHGDKSQGARARALKDFKKGAVRILVATDIAARGLDIKQLPHVVNFDLPENPEDYIHRIGRTGRAGNSGEAVSLVSVDEYKLLKAIERLLKKEIAKTVVQGFEPDPSIRPVVTTRSRRKDNGRKDNGRKGGFRSKRHRS